MWTALWTLLNDWGLRAAAAEARPGVVRRDSAWKFLNPFRSLWLIATKRAPLFFFFFLFSSFSRSSFVFRIADGHNVSLAWFPLFWGSLLGLILKSSLACYMNVKFGVKNQISERERLGTAVGSLICWYSAVLIAEDDSRWALDEDVGANGHGVDEVHSPKPNHNSSYSSFFFSSLISWFKFAYALGGVRLDNYARPKERASRLTRKRGSLDRYLQVTTYTLLPCCHSRVPFGEHIFLEYETGAARAPGWSFSYTIPGRWNANRDSPELAWVRSWLNRWAIRPWNPVVTWSQFFFWFLLFHLI